MWGEWGKSFLILPEFISSAPISCRATLFDFLPFFLLICLGDKCGCPSPDLTPRYHISPCVCFYPLALASSRRRNRYWMQSSCFVGTLSTSCLFHCSNMFGRSIPFHSTKSLRLGYYVPTSLGVISASPSTSCMVVLSYSISPSIGVAQLPCVVVLLGRSVGSFVAWSLTS
jgi:hypothetical protein